MCHRVIAAPRCMQNVLFKDRLRMRREEEQFPLSRALHAHDRNALDLSFKS